MLTEAALRIIGLVVAISAGVWAALLALGEEAAVGEALHTLGDAPPVAAEAVLPDSVAAFIPEHHGTTEITYFLDKAKKTDGGQARNPEDFTYPGPKPRSMETAIAMIADSVEAALRVLEDLTPQKIEEAIDHIVRTKVNAGQLDEAPLTLQQIEQVKAAFLVVLSGMYHNRIDYPESSGGIGAAWQPPPGPPETARSSR